MSPRRRPRQLAAAMDAGGAGAGRAEAPEVIDDNYLEIAQNLERGMWIEFEDEDGQLAFAKLAWVSPLRGTYLFTNRQGQKALSMTAEELAERFRADRARLVEAEPLIDRAFGIDDAADRHPISRGGSGGGLTVVKRIGALIIGDEILSGKRARPASRARRSRPCRRAGLALSWVRYEGDDRGRLTAVLRETFARGELVFSFGGVGATPDDHTRQAAAAALGVPLVRHPEALAEIEARFGEDAYPHRVLMADFPEGSAIIPNPFNRIASFSLLEHHFFPGFPQMAWPMLDWVLATRYPTLAAPPSAERAIVVYGAGESQLLPVMDDNVARFPKLKLFSLPSFMPDGGRRIELGVRGDPELLDAAIAHLISGVEAGGFRWEPFSGIEGAAARDP